MTLVNNINFIKEIEEKLKEALPIRLGVNKLNELVRLTYEVSRAKDISLEEVLTQIDIDRLVSEGRSGASESELTRRSFQLLLVKGQNPVFGQHLHGIAISPHASGSPTPAGMIWKSAG